MEFRLFGLCAIVFFLSGIGFCAVSSSQASDFVAGQGILSQGETAEFPPFGISYNNAKYWVFTIVSSDNVSGFAAVKSDKLEFSTAKATNEQLFKAAYFARSFQKTKQANQSLWFFTQQNSDFFTTMSRLLNSEKESEIDNIASSSSVEKIASGALALSGELESMSSLASRISEKITVALADESSFFESTNPQSANSLVSSFDAVRQDIDGLEQEAIDYGDSVSGFRKTVSDANIELQEKQYLSSLAEPPSVLSSSIIAGKKQSANSTLLAIKESLQNAVSNSSFFAEGFASRLKKAAALSAVYSSDSDFSQKTKYYSTLDSAVKDILSESKASSWHDQSELKKLRSYWSDIQAGLQNSSYDSVVSNAAKAKQSVILVLNSGFKEPEPVEEEPDVSLFYELAIGAAAILVLLFLVRKVLPKLSKPKGAGNFEDFQESYNLKR